MRRNDIPSLYFKWMCDLVCNDKYSRKPSYKKLLKHLNEVEFTYILPMDGNRMYDGINLRYRFGCECGYSDHEIALYLDDRPCSVLEMMVALAKRCEDDIMDNPDIGDRVGQWFWNMIVNLGLGPMHDRNFDEDYIDDVMYTFLNREYSYDGEGSLFVVKDSKKDMRDVEIWYQMCMYLDEFEG